MTDTKNIVIKVKYAASDAETDSPTSQTKMITEWNVKRIVAAIGVIALLIAVSFYFYGGNSEDPSIKTASNTEAQSIHPTPVQPLEPSKQEVPTQESMTTATNSIPSVSTGVETAHTIQPAKIVEPPLKPITPNKRHINNGRVRRAALSYYITKKEPVNPIGSTLNINNSESVWVHYFTEVRGKPRQSLFHEWVKDGKLIYRHELNIAAKRWRTSSQREFRSGDQGNWLARTVDENGGILNQIQFSVVEK
jgi:hypothetical protein